MNGETTWSGGRPSGAWWRSILEARTARFLAAWGAVSLVEAAKLFDPPVWDAAMGLFPAALTLAGNGFDLLELLRLPGYQAGGPNGHSTSPVTLLTALVLMATGRGARGYVVLHLLHFAVTAWALLYLGKLARPVLGSTGAALLVVATLLHPTFSAQTGAMYLEIPLFLCAAAGLLAWMERRFPAAILWGGLAYAIKETGIVVSATLACAALLERGKLADRLVRAAVVLAPPVVWTGLVALLHRLALGSSEPGTLVPSLDAVFGGMMQYLSRFLLNVPDLLAYLTVFALAATLSGPRLLRALRAEPTSPGAPGAEAGVRGPQGEADLVLALGALLVVFFGLLFLVALPAVAGFTVILPRYCVLILPFLLLWVAHAVGRLAGAHARQAAGAALVVLAALFVVNRGGTLYPSDVDTEGPGNDPALTERSNAYRRLLALQLEAVRALEELPAGVPIYYGHYEHYLFAYPELGYARAPLVDGRNFSLESLAMLIRGETIPPCMYALFNYPWLGGERILGLVRFAEQSPDFEAEVVREVRDGRYVITLFEIRHGGADCPT